MQLIVGQCPSLLRNVYLITPLFVSIIRITNKDAAKRHLKESNGCTHARTHAQNIKEEFQATLTFRLYLVGKKLQESMKLIFMTLFNPIWLLPLNKFPIC